ncbi:MAG: hypothetical protein MZV65_39815 [Chromatiales bacterium]|nr:hypothetical protein [Chromatiales bacterium]
MPWRPAGVGRRRDPGRPRARARWWPASARPCVIATRRACCSRQLHLLRDAAWALAIVVWAARRLAGRGRHPSPQEGDERAID